VPSSCPCWRGWAQTADWNIEWRYWSAIKLPMLEGDGPGQLIDSIDRGTGARSSWPMLEGMDPDS